MTQRHRSTVPCEQALLDSGRRSYAYFNSTKNAFATPQVTHHFRLRWPWPVTASAPENDCTADEASAPTTMGTGSSAFHRSRGNDKNSEPLQADHQRHHRDAGHRHDNHVIVDVGQRRYGRPTIILSLSSDPHPPRAADGAPVYRDDTVSRVALLLSSGHRFHLPLIANEDGESDNSHQRSMTTSSSPSHASTGEGGASRPYWRTAYKPPHATPHASSPHIHTELIIGELASVEWVAVAQHRALLPAARTVREATLAGRGSPLGGRLQLHVEPAAGASAKAADVGDTYDRVASSSAAAAAVGKPFWARQTPLPSQLPVHAHLMRSVPYRVLWLSAVPDRILISLSCEESIVTLTVPQARSVAVHGTGNASSSHDDHGGGGPQVPGYTAGQAGPVAIAASHRFHLPRGVVPLDVTEIPQRPFVAVGTYEHGILVCWLCLETGAVLSIVRSIPLSGVTGAIHPITRIAPVFPPMWRFPEALDWPRRSGTRVGDVTTAAHFLASLNDGALVGASIYSVKYVVAKGLAVGTSGIAMESFEGRAQEPMLSVGPQLDEDVGTLASTSTGTLVRFLLYRDAAGGRRGSGARRVRARQQGAADDGDNAVHESSEDGEGDCAIGTREAEKDAGASCRNSGGGGGGGSVDAGIYAVQRSTLASAFFASERLHPVLVQRAEVKGTIAIHRIGETAPIFQLSAMKRYHERGATSGHFLPVSTLENEVALLSHVQTNYQVLSRYRLTPVGEEVSATATMAVKTESGAEDDNMQAAQRDARKQRRERPIASPPPRVFLDDLCSGVVLLSAGHQWLTAAAAHHGDAITVLTYRGPAEELGLLRRACRRDAGTSESSAGDEAV